MTMTPADIETQIMDYTLEEQINLMIFLANIIKQKNAVTPPKDKTIPRQLGGLEEGFWMASDFDDTPDCFKDYRMSFPA